MSELDKLQEEVYKNKLDKGFDTTNVHKEFCLLYGEVAEAYEAWLKGKSNLGEELADCAIYMLGLSQMLGFSLYDELVKKIEVNKHRVYVRNSKGVLVKQDDVD